LKALSVCFALPKVQNNFFLGFGCKTDSTDTPTFFVPTDESRAVTVAACQEYQSMNSDPGSLQALQDIGNRWKRRNSGNLEDTTDFQQIKFFMQEIVAWKKTFPKASPHFDALVKLAIPRINNLAAIKMTKLSFINGNRDELKNDLFNAGCLALIIVITGYDYTTGNMFLGSYMDRIVGNALKNEARKQVALWKKSQSFRQIIDRDTGESGSIENLIVSKERPIHEVKEEQALETEQKRRLPVILALSDLVLNCRELLVLSCRDGVLYGQPHAFYQIAKDFKIDITTVSKAFKQGMNKLKTKESLLPLEEVVLILSGQLSPVNPMPHHQVASMLNVSSLNSIVSIEKQAREKVQRLRQLLEHSPQPVDMDQTIAAIYYLSSSKDRQVGRITQCVQQAIKKYENIDVAFINLGTDIYELYDQVSVTSGHQFRHRVPAILMMRGIKPDTLKTELGLGDDAICAAKRIIGIDKSPSRQKWAETRQITASLDSQFEKLPTNWHLQLNDGSRQFEMPRIRQSTAANAYRTLSLKQRVFFSLFTQAIYEYPDLTRELFIQYVKDKTGLSVTERNLHDFISSAMKACGHTDTSPFVLDVSLAHRREKSSLLSAHKKLFDHFPEDNWKLDATKEQTRAAKARWRTLSDEQKAVFFYWSKLVKEGKVPTGSSIAAEINTAVGKNIAHTITVNLALRALRKIFQAPIGNSNQAVVKGRAVSKQMENITVPFPLYGVTYMFPSYAERVWVGLEKTKLSGAERVGFRVWYDEFLMGKQGWKKVLEVLRETYPYPGTGISAVKQLVARASAKLHVQKQSQAA